MAVSSTSFPKGKSGNPAGMKQGIKRTIHDLFGPLEPLAMENVRQFLTDKDKAVRVEMTKYVIERLHGKVVERKEVTGADGGKIQIEDSTPAIRLLLQQVIAAETKVIEGMAESSDEQE
jgi:hypothetical protein